MALRDCGRTLALIAMFTLLGAVSRLPAQAPPAPPPIMGEQIDALIDSLGSEKFVERVLAQDSIQKRAAQSRENARLIKAHLKDKGLKDGSLEVRTRSQRAIDAIVPLGAFTVDIDATTNPVTGKSDNGDDSKIVADGFKLEISDAFFSRFAGLERHVVLFEWDATEGKETPVSDEIYVDGDGKLQFTSSPDGKESSVNCTLTDLFVCIRETGEPQNVAKALFGDKAGFFTLNVTSAVPEPSTASLLGIGLTAVLGWSRRRRSVGRR